MRSRPTSGALSGFRGKCEGVNAPIPTFGHLTLGQLDAERPGTVAGAILSRCDASLAYSVAAVATSIVTPGPMVELSAIFFM